MSSFSSVEIFIPQIRSDTCPELQLILNPSISNTSPICFLCISFDKLARQATYYPKLYSHRTQPSSNFNLSSQSSLVASKMTKKYQISILVNYSYRAVSIILSSQTKTERPKTFVVVRRATPILLYMPVVIVVVHRDTTLMTNLSDLSPTTP